MNANERFEIIGELYYARFHRLRPGKDDPLQCSHDEENLEQFRRWRISDEAFEDALAAIYRLNAYISKLEAQL